MEASVLKFWRDYVNSLSGGVPREKMPADVFAFGDSREMADQLAMLVREGVKTATCSALWTYEEEQKPLPQKGDYSVVLDGKRWVIILWAVYPRRNFPHPHPVLRVGDQ